MRPSCCPIRRGAVPARRASLGALTLLTGCDIVDSDAAEGMLRKISQFNDWRPGAGCSIRTRWRRNIPKARSRGRSRSTAITPRTRRRRSTARPTSSRSAAWSTTRSRGRSDKLYALPQVSQITRHVCVEGWSAIGSWQGVRLSRIPQADRRRHPRQIRLVPVRRGLFQHHRHADRAASADATDASSSTTRFCRASTASR